MWLKSHQCHFKFCISRAYHVVKKTEMLYLLNEAFSTNSTRQEKPNGTLALDP